MSSGVRVKLESVSSGFDKETRETTRRLEKGDYGETRETTRRLGPGDYGGQCSAWAGASSRDVVFSAGWSSFDVPFVGSAPGWAV